MYTPNCGTTLVSQLLDSINDHLTNVHAPMEPSTAQHQPQDQSTEYEMSVDHPDEDELWLSGHRSIFSSYGDCCRKAPAQLRDSQYEGFHWDLYEDRNYHHLAFEPEQADPPAACQATSLSEWSMRLSSGVIGAEGDTEDDADVEGDDTTSSSDPPRTSWHAIKSKSIHRSCSSSSANTSDGGQHRSRSPLTLYRLFQRARSQQHPCRIYQNFSDKSICDSLTSSSCSNLNKLNESSKQERKVPMPRFQLKSPTTFSQLKMNKSSSHNELYSSAEQSTSKSHEHGKASSHQTANTARRSVDQCLQTSIHVDNSLSPQAKSTRRFIPRSASRPLNTDAVCLQVENNNSVARSKSVDRFVQNTTCATSPSQPSKLPSSASHSSLPTISSLPDLSFLVYYAKENPTPAPPPPSTPTGQPATPQSRMKTTLSEPSSLTKKATRTVFYCSLKVPSPSAANPLRPTTLHPAAAAMQRPRTLKEIKRIKSIKTSPTTTGHSPLRALPLSPSVPTHVDAPGKEEETATFSSTCSSTSTSANSTSSSGYFSNTSTNHPRHIQTPTSSHPLKSCLKRAKTEDLSSTPLTTTPSTTANVLAVGTAGDVFTLAAQTLAARLGDHIMKTSRHRRYSAPSLSSYQQNFSVQLRTRQKGCTLSEHDLRAKKSVSFCDDIARRLITPSASPKHRPTPPPSSSAMAFRYDRGYCDLVPRESLTDSPPSEFNLSDDEHDDNEQQPMNFTENAPTELAKPLPVKYGSDKYLVDAFASTILRILEIKCGDPQSQYLNNVTNRELDRTLRQDLCPLLREVLEDGLRQYSGSLFSKKVNLWRLIDLTTPTTGRYNEAKVKAQLGLSSTVDWTEKFNGFIYHLLNLHELAAWLTHFVSHRAIFTGYYEPWAFVLVHADKDLFERVTNQLEKLSPLPFRLKYSHSSTVTPPARGNPTTSNQRPSSLLPKRFNVRAWLRDRKTQVKISPKEPQAPPLPATTSNKTSSSKSQASAPAKTATTVPTAAPPPNVSLRRKLGSIPVPKRHQTVH